MVPMTTCLNALSSSSRKFVRFIPKNEPTNDPVPTMKLRSPMIALIEQWSCASSVNLDPGSLGRWKDAHVRTYVRCACQRSPSSQDDRLLQEAGWSTIMP